MTTCSSGSFAGTVHLLLTYVALSSHSSLSRAKNMCSDVYNNPVVSSMLVDLHRWCIMQTSTLLLITFHFMFESQHRGIVDSSIRHYARADDDVAKSR